MGEKDSVIYKHDFGKPVKEKIAIPYRSNALRFSSSAIFYTENERTEYSYFIENFDKTWSPWTNKSEKEYINLPPGNYRFMVKAKNIFRTESNTASFAFRIRPPWYRSTLAYLVYAIVAIALFCLWYFDLLRRHTQEKDFIKEESQKEIDESKNQVKEIYQRKTEEIMQLQNEKLEAEVNHKNQELATTALHLINKNQLLSEIRRNLTISQNVNDPDIQNVIGKIDRSIKHDSNWEMFQVHFDRVHVDFTKRLAGKHQNLSPQDLKIAAYLRMNLSSKEMAELLNVSVTGIEKARYRLRKKINLERNDNLTEYISKI